MKKIIFIITTLCISFIWAQDYYIFLNAEKEIKIRSENKNIDANLSFILQNAKEGDRFFFKRGDIFKTPIEIKNKKQLSFLSYGKKEASLPIINALSKIEIEEKYLRIIKEPQIFSFHDRGWRNLRKDFKNYTKILTTKLRNEIADSFYDIRDKLSAMARFKLPIPKYGYYDPNAIRLFYKDKELLKVLLFEELNCDECKEKIRWYFESKTGYMYLFFLSDEIDPKEVINNLFINNDTLAAFSMENSENITIKQLDLRGGKYSLLIKTSSKIKVLDMKIGNYSFTGIYVISDEKPSSKIVIKNCLIDSKFNFNYRYYSSRGSQDGIFFIGNVRESIIKKCDIRDWGHNGITLSAPGETKVKNNFITLNKISGKNLPYMHGIIIDNQNCINNKAVLNLIENTSAPNQINGIGNSFENNIVLNVKNSQIKKDQGYGSGIAVQIQAYGRKNLSVANSIKNNYFINCEETGLSIIDNGYDGEKRKNLIEKNIFINTQTNPLKKEKGVFIRVDKNNHIKDNYFTKNRFYSDKNEKILIYYKDDYLTVKEFNKLKNADKNEELQTVPITEEEVLEYFKRERDKEP